MKHCALVSVNGGWNLLIGADAESTGAWSPIKVPEACREVFDEAQKDVCFGREARRYIRHARGIERDAGRDPRSPGLDPRSLGRTRPSPLRRSPLRRDATTPDTRLAAISTAAVGPDVSRSDEKAFIRRR